MRDVAIVGAGPAGCALGARLARAGARVAIFDAGRPRAPIVGESLVPAVVPHLRALGVEDEIARGAVYKPGASFALGDEVLHFAFSEARGRVPDYAYNVPRDRFDAALRGAARRAGARLLPQRAVLERDPDAGDEPRPRLGGEARGRARELFGGDPELLVDATGRGRALARLLELPAAAGARRDTALFAHFEGVQLDREGHVHTDRLGVGWCWRIPLPGRVSLGVVVRGDALRGHGSSAEEQLDGVLRKEPHLRRCAAGARRVTPVVRYTNYQQTTLRAVGPGWALVGDAFGFIDPVFSSGLALALDGAERLFHALRRGTRRALRGYERAHLRHLDAWRRVVGYWYDGRLLALLRLRDEEPTNTLGRWLHPHAGRHVPRIFTGEARPGSYSLWLLELLIRRAATPPDADALRIH